MKVGVVEVSVDDQHGAGLYTGVVGFQVKDDASYGDTARWLTFVSPEDPAGPQLLLAAMNEAAAALQPARRETGTPAVSFTTEDCHRDYRARRAGRRVGVRGPTDELWGHRRGVRGLLRQPAQLHQD